VDVRALAVPIEDHDQFGGPVNGCGGVGRHGGELGSLPRFDDDFAIAEQQAHSTQRDE
jgi:hypothetical protein